jgi:hypothetical protein
MTQEPQHPFTILVPLDGSVRAASALPVAVDLSQRLNGELALIQVLPVISNPLLPEAGYVAPEIYQRTADDQQRLAHEKLSDAISRLARRDINQLPVVDLSGQLLGMLNRDQVIRYLEIRRGLGLEHAQRLATPAIPSIPPTPVLPSPRRAQMSVRRSRRERRERHMAVLWAG